MKKTVLIILIITILLFSCKTLDKTYDNSKYQKVITVEPEPIVNEIKTEVVKYVFLDSSQEKVTIEDDDSKDLTKDELIEKANKDNQITVLDASYLKDNIVEYTYKEGATYQILSSPGFITDLRLEPDEEVTGTPAIGDPNRWEISAINSIENDKIIQHFFISPLTTNIKTTMIIPTNKRTYYFNLESIENTYMIAVKFRYYKNRNIKVSQSYPITNTSIQDLNFNYSIEKVKGKPKWKPVAIFNDKEHTYIDLGNLFEITAGAPSLYYTKGWKKPPEQINSRLQGSMYIVDFVLDSEDYFLLKENDDEIFIKRRK